VWGVVFLSVSESFSKKMEYMQSEKGRKIILYHGYKFQKTYETNIGWKWRCTKKYCLAKLYAIM
jgi:hypothetical protein